MCDIEFDTRGIFFHQSTIRCTAIIFMMWYVIYQFSDEWTRMNEAHIIVLRLRFKNWAG